jgi:hypothetical protein
MGLHRTAHYLKTKGRNGDTELVHMTPDEVKGLQAIALRHGGSLTINPDTGLPEANFLKRALPTIAGIGVGVATGNPMLGSAVAGGLTMATGGSLMQGLMAGVGAYGGAGMMSGLAEAGATQIAAEVAPAAMQQQAVASGLPEVVSAAQTTPASINAAAEAMANMPPAMPPVLPAAQTTAASIDAAANAMSNMPPTSPIQPGTPLNQVADMYNKGQLTTSQYTNYANAHEAARLKAMESPFSSAFRGLGVGGPQGFSPTNLATNVYDVVKRDPTKLAMAAAPLLTNMETEKRGGPAGSQSDEYDERLKKYRLSPNYQAYEAPRPNPFYSAQYPTYAAEGGIMQSYQAGGPVERMSMANTAMNPQGGLYPMGMIDKTQYASPIQRPVSSEMVMDTPGYERSNPMLMASGGIAGFAAGKYLPKGDPGIYRDTDPSTRGLSALDAEEVQRKKLMKRFGIPMAEMPKTGIKSLGGDFSDVGAAGGTASLGGYSDGGRMLKGPGDGMSDSIPASIANKQPARLADGEFVVPADVVSHLGNGSTDAGARKLYSMMDKIRKARTGKKKQAPAVKADRYMPA